MATDSGSPGASIRAARTAAGMTVRELARRINVSAATISAIENGKTGVTVARLQEVAVALGVSPSRILNYATSGSTQEPLPRSSRAPDPDSSDWRQFPPLNLDPVLQGALDCFVETGYHATSMRTLAARIGVSVPAIYHHYADKQQLLVGILDIAMSELHWRVAAARAQASTSRGEVALIVEALALFHTHRQQLAFIGVSEMRSLEGVSRRRITKSRDSLQHSLDDAIDRAIDDGYLHCTHPRAAARAVVTMCTSLPQWFRPGGGLTARETARAYVEYALSMLGAGQASSQFDDSERRVLHTYTDRHDVTGTTDSQKRAHNG